MRPTNDREAIAQVPKGRADHTRDIVIRPAPCMMSKGRSKVHMTGDIGVETTKETNESSWGFVTDSSRVGVKWESERRWNGELQERHPVKYAIKREATSRVLFVIWDPFLRNQPVSFTRSTAFLVLTSPCNRVEPWGIQSAG